MVKSIIQPKNQLKIKLFLPKRNFKLLPSRSKKGGYHSDYLDNLFEQFMI